MKVTRKLHAWIWPQKSAILLLCLSMLVGGCAGHAARSDHASAASGKENQVQVTIQAGEDPTLSAQIEAATRLIQHGQFLQAIQGPIRKTLASFPGAIAKGDTRYYSTATPADAILYAGMDSGKYTHIDVMSGAWARALFLEGFAYNSLHRYEEARRALSLATALSPMNPHLFNELGYTCERLKDWPQAMQAFKNAENAADFLDGKRKVDEKTRAIRGQGYVLVELNKLDEAQAAYHRALAIDPGDVKSMGQLHYIQEVRQARAKSH
jgi:tetratricopeptide (TPR) repeat protein